jgi:hypothetical protein
MITPVILKGLAMTENNGSKCPVRSGAAEEDEDRAVPPDATPDSPLERSEARPARLLTVAVHSWIKHDLAIADENDTLLYTASWRAGFPTAVWTLRKGSEDVAVLRREALAPLRRCVVKLGGQEFTLRRKLCVSRVTEIAGGPFDGAILSGSLADLDFRLENNGILIAEAKADWLSMKDRYAVRLNATDDPAAERLTALLMVDLMIQKQEEF